MRSIMYHYVQEYNSSYPYFAFLNYKNFAKQINYFKKKYTFFDCNDLSNFKYNSDIKDKIFLTFDDGLSCHYDYVLKILKSNEINAIFYIPTNPLRNGNILDVHKIHLILGKIGGKVACKYIEKYITKEMLCEEVTNDYEKSLYRLQNNTDYVRNFKKTLNYYIKYEFRNKIINNIFIDIFGNIEKNLVKNFYLSLIQIKELYLSGMVIGSHGNSHKLMSRLSEKVYKKEIEESFDFLHNYINFKTFAYPYGGEYSFNKNVELLLEQKSVDFSVSVESRSITNNDLQYRRQALPRYDCNEFSYGKIDSIRS